MEDHDVEVFERIPWESLEQNPNRRWIPYLVATAVVLGAVGVTIGRGMITSPAEQATVLATTTAPMADSATEPVVDETGSPDATIPPPQESTWSEADLMALPEGAVESAAMAVAEWFVVEHFTREGDEGRSFVDWARAGELTWMDSTTVDVTVLVRRLAAEGDDPYQRLPAEAWQVTTELEGDRWVVTHGPVPLAPPKLEVSVPSLDDHVPDEVGADSEGSIVGAAQIDEDSWSVGVEWTDAAGLTWLVRDRAQLTPDE